MHQPLSTAAPDSATATRIEHDATTNLRTLRALQLAFIILTITVVTLDALAIPFQLAQLSTPAVLHELHRIHFSPTLYTVVMATESTGYSLIYLLMALLLFWRRRNDQMAVFCALMLMLFGCATTGGFLFDISSGNTTPILGNTEGAHLLILALFSGGQMCFLLFFYLFPSGHFAPRWTRWATLAAGVYWLVSSADPMILTGPAGNLILVFILTAVIAQVYRYLRVSSPSEREQTKWVVFGFSIGIAFIAATQIAYAVIPQALLGTLVDNSPLIGSLVFGAPWEIGLGIIPIFIAIAILRSRLWEIDLLINRTLVYGVLTASLGAIYAGLTIGMQTLSSRITGSAAAQPTVIVVSTLVIAALVQPLRSRIQRTIDQRFYRSKYDAAKTISAFSDTLRQEVDLDDLRARLLMVVDSTMQPARVSLWLRPTPDTRHS